MIEFHCQFCTKLIRAGDEHAGKHGTCPSCHQKVYIPTPENQIELLKVEPLDLAAEAEQRRLDAEAKAVARRVLHERDAEPVGPRGAAAPISSVGPSPAETEALVIQYVLTMAQGGLERAQQLAADIRRHMKTAEPIIQRLSMDEIPPPQLTKVPRPVLNGFLKQLLHK